MESFEAPPNLAELILKAFEFALRDRGDIHLEYVPREKTEEKEHD